MNKQDLEDFLERNGAGLLDDIEMADFIELHLINSSEQAEFKKRRITVAGCFTGKWEATVSNENFINKTFRRWNEFIATSCARMGLTPPKNPVFMET